MALFLNGKQIDKEQVYADNTPMSASDSETIAEKFDGLNATNLPIESGSATNTKDYIDNGLSGKADTTALPFVKYEELNVVLDNSGEGTLFTTNKYVVGIKDIPSDSLYVGYNVYYAGTLTKCKAFSRSALAFTSQGVVSMTRKIGVYYLDNIASQ